MASNPSSTASVTQPESEILKRKSNDIGWEFGMLIDPKNLDKIKCKLCGKIMSEGVYRIKEHIGNIPTNVFGCQKASQEDKNKCKQAILEGRNRKKNKIMEEQSCKAEVAISLDGEEDLEIEGMDGIKKPRPLGPMDRYALVIAPENLLPSLDQYRLHTGKEQEQKNVVPLPSVIKGVLLQQLVQATVAGLMFLVLVASDLILLCHQLETQCPPTHHGSKNLEGVWFHRFTTLTSTQTEASALTISKVLSICSLLTDPNLDDHLVPEITHS
ncbi:hypothetical protein ZIOFF_021864 [Zingiber officinale]|uniref:BED-type domain-containing protein n=1 Tax=Zingiber officinale TaxID=94328 RepID=A0A8J5LMB4_ZINOF|nr:hypothetical protein ZIOFF_021864 [Zingiber officinale]